MPSNALAGAVVPRAPDVYDRAYMDRLVDTINKIIEQVVRPQQIAATSLVLTALGHETPRYDIEGEVYSKEFPNLGPDDIVLCIDETLPERSGRRAK
jgi:hypothetical protein